MRYNRQVLLAPALFFGFINPSQLLRMIVKALSSIYAGRYFMGCTMKKLLIFLPVLFIMFGCTNQIDIAAEKEAMMQADRDFSRLSIEQGMYEAFDTYMTDSATIYRNHQHPFTGREAIRSILPKDDLGTLKWEPLYADIAQSGDLGYTLGKYEYIFTDSTGAEQISKGYYVTIWKKQADGSWKYVFDTGVQAPEDN